MSKKVTRICPCSKRRCGKKLPEHVDSVVLHKDTAICGLDCAERFAAQINQVVSGEHLISENGRRRIEYSTSQLRETPAKEIR